MIVEKRAESCPREVVHLCDERSNLEGKRHIAVVEKLFQTKEEMEKAEREREADRDREEADLVGGDRGDTSPRQPGLCLLCSLLYDIVSKRVLSTMYTVKK